MEAHREEASYEKETNVNILRFPTSVPLEVALASAGTLVQGRYGDRMKFNLTDGQVMYVPPIVASKIEAEGIGPGERFELCKVQVKSGQRRSIEWSVRRLNPEEVRAAEPTETIDVPETQLESDLRASVDLANSKNGDEPAASENARAASAPSNGHTNGATPSAQPVNPPLTKLESALKTAIAAAHNAEKYGTEIGYVVRFDADAIKSMAITVLINMSEGNRRWAN
jgi:hypothetical protein